MLTHRALASRPALSSRRCHAKITFAEIRESGVDGLLIHGADYQRGLWLQPRNRDPRAGLSAGEGLPAATRSIRK